MPERINLQTSATLGDEKKCSFHSANGSTENFEGVEEDFRQEDITTLSLGKPVTAPVLVPVTHKSTPVCINSPFMVDGECFRLTAIAFDSPHGAVVVDNVDAVDVPTLGGRLGTHILFPKGASIVFIQVLDKESLKVRIWQWGKGEIAFAPEAACVAGTAVMMLQRVLGNKVNVVMGGSVFKVKWERGNGGVSITGPAELMQA